MDTKGDVDAIWRSLRPLRLYQIIQMGYILLCLIQVSFLVLNIIYLGYVPKHSCAQLQEGPLQNYGLALPGNLSDYDVEYRQCDVSLYRNSSAGGNSSTGITTPCLDGYKYELKNADTIVSEWNLICDRSGLGELGQTIVVIGQACGATIFTSLGDKLGRKPVFVWTHIFMLGLGIGLSFVPNISAFLIIRFILGSLQQGMGLCSAVLYMELFPAEHRGTTTVIGSMAWSINVVMLTGLGYFMRDLSWRYLQFATAIVSLHCIFAFWISDESLRWLILNNRKEEAVRIIKKAAKWNKSSADKALLLLRTDDEVSENMTLCINNSDHAAPESQATNESTMVKKDEFKDIFRNKTLLRNTLLLWFMWFVNSMTYYGLFMTSSSFVGNRYLNVFLNAVVEIPGTILYYFCVNRLSRRINGILFHCVAGISLIITVILLTVAGNSSTANSFAMALNLVGKMAISASWSLVFLYTPELFPTNLRNIGFGTCSTASRIGAMVAPYSRILAEKVLWAPGLVFGSGCIVVAYTFTLLPETKDRILPQTLEEFKAWSSKERKSLSNDIRKKENENHK